MTDAIRVKIDGVLKFISKLAVDAQLYRVPFLWNIQYKRGRWGRLQQGRRKKLLKLIEGLAKGGRIIELCCGEGALICELDTNVYSSYSGSDISDQAVGVARRKTKELGLDNCLFETLDMMKWSGDSNVTLVILEECIYYLPKYQQRKILDVSYRSLISGGNIILTFHSAQKHKETIENCVSFNSSARRVDDGGGVYLVIRKS